MPDFAIEILRGATLQLAAITELPRVELNLSEVRLRIEVRPESLLPDAVVRIVEEARVDLVQVLVPVPGTGGGNPAPAEYARRVDVVSGDVAYRGEAALGAADEAAAVWRIRRIEISQAGEAVITSPTGSHAFAFRWDQRQAYTYE